MMHGPIYIRWTKGAGEWGDEEDFGAKGDDATGEWRLHSGVFRDLHISP